jgi:hypothetical protein
MAQIIKSKSLIYFLTQSKNSILSLFIPGLFFSKDINIY